MANDMTPKRGYSFPDTPTLPGSKINTELDKVYKALNAQLAFVSQTIGPDGNLLGKNRISQANLHPDLLRHWIDQTEHKLAPMIQKAEDLLKSTLQQSNQATTSAKTAQDALSQAEKQTTQSLTALQQAKTILGNLTQTRSRVEQAQANVQIRAQDAQTSASSARISEDMSYRWAEKLDGPVFVPQNGDPVDDGFYSSKYWALYAETTISNGSFWYLGPHPAPPTEGNNGVPLVPGMWYFDTTDGQTYIWNGTNWEAISGNVGEVISVFGRKGAVQAQEGDYSQFFVLKTGGTFTGDIEIQGKITQNRQSFEMQRWIRSADGTLNARWNMNADGSEFSLRLNDTTTNDYTFVPGAPEDPLAPQWVLTRKMGDFRYAQAGTNMRWRGPWASANTYELNDVTLDWPYLMIANKQTTEKPAPIDVGEPFNVYDGSEPTQAITAKTLLVGNTYTIPETLKVPSVRVYTITGNFYSVYLQDNTTGQITNLRSFEATETGWVDIAGPGNILAAGSSFDVALYVQEPDPTPTIFSGNWSYQKPNNASVPASGQVSHANRLLSSLRVHKTDNDGGDRSAELATIAVGDTIAMGDLRWAVSAIQDAGTYYDFSVNPQQQDASSGVQQFNFETVTATPITVVADPDYYLGNADIRPFYSIDGQPRILTDDAYNVDIEIQQVAVSEDWDLMAVSGGGTSGGGGENPGGGASVTTGPTFPTSPTPGDLHYKTVETVGLYVYYDDGDSTQWVQTNGSGGLDDGGGGGAAIRLVDLKHRPVQIPSQSIPENDSSWTVRCAQENITGTPFGNLVNWNGGAGDGFEFTEAGLYRIHWALNWFDSTFTGGRFSGWGGLRIFNGNTGNMGNSLVYYGGDITKDSSGHRGAGVAGTVIWRAEVGWRVGVTAQILGIDPAGTWNAIVNGASSSGMIIERIGD